MTGFRVIGGNILYLSHDALLSEEVSMKSPVLSVLGLAFTVGILSGCSGSDNPPIVSSGPAAAAAEDQRVPQADALTAAEAGQVNQANAEPDPAQKQDI